MPISKKNDSSRKANRRIKEKIGVLTFGLTVMLLAITSSAVAVNVDDEMGSTNSSLNAGDVTSIDVVPASHSNAMGVVPIEVRETMLVRGTTNLQPDDNMISVSAVNGPSMNKMPVGMTDTWKRETGIWSVTIDTSGLEAGRYKLEVEDGYSADTVEVEIVPEGERNDVVLSSKSSLAERISNLQSQVEKLQAKNEELQKQVSELEVKNENLNTQLENATLRNEKLKRKIDDLDNHGDDGNFTKSLNGGEEGQGQSGFGVATAFTALFCMGLIALRGALR